MQEDNLMGGWRRMQEALS